MCENSTLSTLWKFTLFFGMHTFLNAKVQKVKGVFKVRGLKVPLGQCNNNR